jgi:hypothetical protein
MSNYPKDIDERIAINLYRKQSPVEAYDVLFNHPELLEEMERDDLTAVEMMERIISRNGGES